MNELTKPKKQRSVTVIAPKQITPSRGVLAGWNGTVAGLNALAASLERSKQ
jgi:hypothetical protein